MSGLRRSLLAGALLDAGFGVPLLLAPRELTTLLQVPASNLLAFRLVGLLLLILAGCYGYAAQDPFRYVGVTITAIAGRTAGGVLFLLAALQPQAPLVYLLVGIADLGLALLHAVLGRDLFRGPDRPSGS